MVCDRQGPRYTCRGHFVKEFTTRETPDSPAGPYPPEPRAIMRKLALLGAGSLLLALGAAAMVQRTSTAQQVAATPGFSVRLGTGAW